MKTLSLLLALVSFTFIGAQAQSFTTAYTEAKVATSRQTSTTPHNSHMTYVNDHSLEATKEGKHAVISWSTVNDGFSFFYLILKSADGLTFTPFKVINLQKGKKDQYNIVDTTPSKYYKLIQVDQDWNKYPSSIKTLK